LEINDLGELDLHNSMDWPLVIERKLHNLKRRSEWEFIHTKVHLNGRIGRMSAREHADWINCFAHSPEEVDRN
jgi:hypothetical protein